MHHKQTITGVYYADLLCKLLVAVKKKRRGELTQVPLLLHDNASAHRPALSKTRNKLPAHFTSRFYIAAGACAQ